MVRWRHALDHQQQAQGVPERSSKGQRGLRVALEGEVRRHAFDFAFEVT